METHVQHSIKYCLVMIAPFEMPTQQKEDGRLQLYQFMFSLYREMYQQPEVYMVFSKSNEDYGIDKALCILGKYRNINL